MRQSIEELKITLMSSVLQNYLAEATLKGAADLETALLRVPEDKRLWSPMGDARSAADMVAECAILHKNTARTIENRAFPEDFDWMSYVNEKDALARKTEELLPLLHQNAALVASVIRAVLDEDLEAPVQMPWRPMTVTELMSYPSWNMSYHEGQINYIASMLGCLK